MLALPLMVSYTFVTQAKWSPLHTLSLSGLVPFMDKLLEDGVDINLFDKVSLILNLIHHICLQIGSTM